MHSTLVMRFILWLSCVIAIVSVAVDDSNASTGSKTTLTPEKKGDNIEEAIQSLEATLEKNFQQLIRVVNATSGGNRPDVPGKMCLNMLLCVLVFSIFYFLLCA